MSAARGKGRRRPRVKEPPPRPLERAPRTDLQARVEDLNASCFAALDAAAGQALRRVEGSSSLSEMQLDLTRAHLLRAMQSTHRSICGLVSGGGELDQSVDALPLTRVQMERCFLALLLADKPGRWHKRYRKNAWKAYAEKFFRDQRTVGHMEPYRAYFASDGEGVALLRQFAHEMDVSEDEFQTLRHQIVQDEPDPRWKQWYIPDMPTPGKTLRELKDPAYRGLAELLYPYYDSLSHFSHGGLAGITAAAILRRDLPGKPPSESDQHGFWYSGVMEQTLPLSYVAMLLTATLAHHALGDDADVRTALDSAWRPYHADGSALGVAVWDAWAGEVVAGPSTARS